MVQVETSQLTGECNSWREKLRQYRDEFSKDKTKLQDAASRTLSREQLQQVEHLHNQFHIQLINIHDLKHAIKAHDQRMNYEHASNGKLNGETMAEHENLLDQFQSLESTLLDLREEFDDFLDRTS
jgi:chromosome segregation ATPase